MPRVRVELQCPVHHSFRLNQLAGMFDLAPAEKLHESFEVEIPALSEDWQIGAIVGPSGSGKTSIARHYFGAAVYTPAGWPESAAVIDGFGERSVKEITKILSAVGFSSPPSWLKPYAVLSNGEKFRADLARGLLEAGDLLVYDEFTSVVDRTVAKIGSVAVNKAVRKNRIAGAARRFVAVTCHYDILDWLEPDWVVDMASCQLARGRLQRPAIELEVAPVHGSAWLLFRRHHYLSGNLSVTARCFAAFFEGQPCAFSAWVHAMTRDRRRGDMREHRTVVLPDYQGVGIGNRLSEFCASIWTGLGGRVFSTTSHPSMIHYRSSSPLWRRRRLGIVSPAGGTGLFSRRNIPTKKLGSVNRITGGFQYVGPPLPIDRAREFVALADPLDWTERLIRAQPGATVSFLVRHLDLSQTCIRAQCEELLAAGKIRREGVGGPHGRQHAFYPVTEALSE